ncbi:enoyl-CoA hydratase-related protein [Pseudoduganella namucuonensis]|uniref:2-(1,2-epoxy-1,2-dihydrophenyl)acetyl-CoA isomerase n=1 Tax=Pseudoduganella namucuonensis TaxID=1035707 RepID=A0A1I7M030_9BURK|nr:enoyl-CoA hydratase-related protein [Pseudoduganella namucuonensis]SFV15312.1 2-(1,2-epoxy-1,2-dihydrophenyl)acetyl-CoA isomerase [Pseudoduganella namucuonensis]
MSEYKCVTFEVDDGVAIVTLNQPEKRNPLSPLQAEELLAVLARVRADRSLRVLILTGAGKSFCAGANLDDMAAGGDRGKSLGESTADAMEALWNPLILALQDMPVPVLTAMNGGAVGGGAGLALAADVVIAARSAYFYLPSMPRLGLVPDLGGSWFLRRQAGRARAMGLTLLGERLSAEQAAQWGLVWLCVDDDDLRAESLALARRLAALPAHAALETRRADRAAGGAALAEQLAYEAARQRELIDRDCFAEGVRAFAERRDPVFPGR